MCKQKLLARRGETLAEVLVAILVCGFSITMLAGMIMTSMNINSQAREMDDTFFASLTQAETHTFTTSDDTCQVKLTGGASEITLNARKHAPEGSGLTVYGEVSP